MKFNKSSILFVGFLVLTIGASGIFYFNHQSRVDGVDLHDVKRADHSAKIKFDTFKARADKAKKKGRSEQVKAHYLQAAKVLELDFEATKSKYIARLLFQIYSEPEFEIQNDTKQLYYAKYLDSEEFKKLHLNLLYNAVQKDWALDAEKRAELCLMTRQSVNEGDLRILYELIRMMKAAQNNGYDVGECSGRTFTEMKYLFFSLVEGKGENLSDQEAQLVFLLLSFFKVDQEKYDAHIIPAIFERKKFSINLTYSIHRFIERQNNEVYKRKFIRVLELTDKQSPKILSLRGDFYRSDFLSSPRLDEARMMYEQAAAAGLTDVQLTLFYMQYLGLGGKVDKVAAFENISSLVKEGNQEAQLIDLCLVISGSRKKLFKGSIEERLKEFRWSDNGRAINALAAYWGVSEYISAREAYVLMEDAALGGSDWGRAGMALFYEAGYGVDKNDELADVWKNKIGQGNENLPVYFVPIKDCTPRSI